MNTPDDDGPDCELSGRGWRSLIRTALLLILGIQSAVAVAVLLELARASR